MENKISIVIPVHNAEQTLARCLDSIFALDYKNFEVIVVDDYSTDSSVEIAKRYSCKILVLPERRGPAFARDRGSNLADGEIVAFLDSDCIVPEDWLNKINKRLTSDIVGIGGRYDFLKDTDIISKLFMAYWYLKDIVYTKPRALVSLYGGNCAFWRSSLLRIREKKELLYCSKMVGSDDTLMCCELARFGRVIYDPDISVIHNPKYTLLDILKKSIFYGYNGARTTGLCGGLLFKEPHHLYKSLLYILSLSLLILPSVLLILPIWKVYFFLLIVYLAAQLPIIILAYRRSLKSPYIFLLPITVFTISIFNFIGHIKALLQIIHGIIKKVLWHIKFIINIINPSSPSRIFFFVTTRCNADCYFCFNKNGGRVYNKENELSLDEIKVITEDMGFLPWLVITGGEPFLREDLYDICKLFYNNCDTRFITIVSNGILSPRIEETVERLLIDCGHLHLAIVIALDNIEEKHDYLKGVNGCYSVVLSVLEKLNGLKSRFSRLTLDVNTILVKENADDIEYILDYFNKNLNYDRHYLNLLRQPASTSIEPEFISIEKYFKLLQKANMRFKGRLSSIKEKFYKSLLEYCRDKSLKEYEIRGSLRPCLAARKFFVIKSDGYILACELLAERIGNLRDEGYNFRKIMRSQKVKEARLRIRENRCYCQWPCAVTSNIIFNISSYLRILSATAATYFKKPAKVNS